MFYTLMSYTKKKKTKHLKKLKTILKLWCLGVIFLKY